MPSSTTEPALRSPDFERAWELCRGIEGWLTRGQALTLFRSALTCPSGSTIVEIGSHHGRSTVILAEGASEEMLAVDPFDDPRWGGGDSALPIFEANLERAEVADRVRVFRGLSSEAASAWDGSPIGLVYVDGAHDHATVIADIDGWEPFVIRGGRVIFHDAFSAVGVTRALLERHLWNRSFCYVGSIRTLCIFERRDLSVREAALSGVRLASRLGYFLRNLAVKVAMKRGWTSAQRLLRHHEKAFPY